MEKVNVPFKGKTYTLNCCATELEDNIIFCFATQNHEPLSLIGSDFFFLKLNKFNPSEVATNGYANSNDEVAFKKAATEVVMKRFIGVDFGTAVSN